MSVWLCELLLNLIFATRSVNWQLYLSCIEETILWAFAYDRQNCARYLVPYLNGMLGLPVTMLEVYSAFMDGQFSVQMGKVNPFGQDEADKTIENTINRDCKTGGGLYRIWHKFCYNTEVGFKCFKTWCILKNIQRAPII